METAQITLATRPTSGAVLPDHFAPRRAELPPLGADQVLLQTRTLSLDPYMRARMNDRKSYSSPTAIGDVMPGVGIAEVVESRHADFRAGDRVIAGIGWQTAGVFDGGSVQRLPSVIDELDLPESFLLGVLGAPGLTAYTGLTEIGRMSAGETLVVSAAAGPVGSTVGQLAARLGARTVGIVGGPEKCRLITEEFGFDAAVDHRSESFEAELAAACPDGIDFDFENVGGRVFTGILPLLNRFGRVAVCGLVAQHHGTDHMPSAGDLLRASIDRSLTIRGFLVNEFSDRYKDAFYADVSRLLADGAMVTREHKTRGFDAIIPTFIDLLEGRTIGKALVQL